MINQSQIDQVDSWIAKNSGSDDPKIQSQVAEFTEIVAKSKTKLKAENQRLSVQSAKQDRYGADLTQAAAQGASFGFADEIQGAGAAVGSWFDPNQSMGDAYTQTRDKVRGTNEDFRKSNPKASLAAEAAGGFVGGGLGVLKAAGLAGKVGRVKGAATAGSSLVHGARVGATQGAAYGVGASDAETLSGNVADAAGGAITGGVLGGAMGLAGGKIAAMAATKSERASLKLMDEALPTSKNLKDKAQKFYDAIGESDVSITKGSAELMRANMKLDKGFIKEFDSKLHTEVRNVLKIMDEQISEGNLKFSQIERYRKNLKAISGNPIGNEQQAAYAIAKYIDDFVGNVSPKSITGTLNDEGAALVGLLADKAGSKSMSSAQKIAEGFKVARSDWRKHKKVELISEVYRKADAAENTDEAVALGMRAIHDGIGKKYKGLFSVDEQKLLLKSTKGGVRDALGFTTKFFQGLGGSNLPGSGVLKGIGWRTAAKLTKVNTRKLDRAIRSGSDPQLIARLYIKSHPKGSRDAAVLAKNLKNSSPEQLARLGKQFKEETIQRAVKIAMASGTVAGLTGKQYTEYTNQGQ